MILPVTEWIAMMIEILGMQFNLFEIFLVPIFYFMFPVLVLTKIKLVGKKFLKMYLFFVVLFLFSILISFYVAIHKEMVIKTFFKWLEIFGLSITVFLYSSSERRFQQIWRLLVLIFVCDILISLVNTTSLIVQGMYYSNWRKLFPDYSSLFLFSLILPYSIRNLTITIVSGILAILTILSLTRGAWIGLMVVISYFAWKVSTLGFSRECFKNICLLLVLIIGVFLFSISIFPQIRDIFILKFNEFSTLNTASNIERLGMAILSLHAFIEKPLTGIGAENFSSYMLLHGIPEFIHSREPEKLTPHNFFLQIAAENGILGITSVIGLLLIMWNILSYSNKSIKKEYLLSLKLFFISLVINLLFGYVAGEQRIVLGLYMGLVLACLRTSICPNII